MKQNFYAIASDVGWWSGIGWTKNINCIQWHVGHSETVEKHSRISKDFGEVYPRVVQKYKKGYWS